MGADGRGEGEITPSDARASGETAPPLSAFPALSRFRIVRRLGEGGMGVVYEAIDRDRDTRVALKTLRRLDGDLLLRLKDEFRALQDVQHPGLVTLGELLHDAGTWFFTMELIDGVDLFEHVTLGKKDREGAHTFDEMRLRASLVKLAAGLRALHTAGKVHRDIKPSNVLVTGEGRVVLLDFGLVRDAREPDRGNRGFVVGTVHYMAPEQAAGDDVGPAADWYGVGVVLYECLTGRRPFEGAVGRVLQKKQAEDPVPPRDVVPGLPEDLDALCVALLRRRPADRPTAADVIQRMVVHAPRGSIAPYELDVEVPSGRSPFVGRDDEVRVLLQAWNGLLAKRAATIIVEGESGVGKSTLVRRFTATLPSLSKRAVLLAGRCYERETVPFKAVDGVIDSLSRYLEPLDDAEVGKLLPPSAWLLAHVFPVLRRVPALARLPWRGHAGLDAQESRARLFIALRELLRNLAEASHVVVVIDDLQWADADSLALLAEITRPPSPPPVLLVATGRSHQSGSSAEEPRYGLPGEVTTLPLGRLTSSDALLLAGMLLQGEEGADPEVAASIAAEADGHPLFLDELARHVRFLGGQAPKRVHLDAALAARAFRLEPPARVLLELLAVAGVSLAQTTAMRATGLGFAEFGKHVSALRVAHLARTDGHRGEDSIEPYHDRVREAVAARLDEETRKARHERLALALEGEGNADPEALATHWLGAGDAARAGGYALDAAHRAFGALAFERAAHLYGRALEHAPLDEVARQQVRVKRGAALGNAGRASEAALAYVEAASHAGPEQGIDLRRRAAEELLIAGHIAEGIAALRIVLVAVGLRIPATPLGALLALLVLRVRIYFRGTRFRERTAESLPAAALIRLDACWGVARMLSLVDTVRGSYLQSRALLFALDLGEPVRVSLALSLDAAWRAAARGTYDARTTSTLAQADAIARRADHGMAMGLAIGARGAAAYFNGKFREAFDLSDRAREVFRDRAPGAFWENRTASTIAIWALQWLGELKEVAARVEMCLLEAEHRGDVYAGATFSLGRGSFTWLRTDAVEQTRANAKEASRRWSPRGYHVPDYSSMIALAELDLYEGKGREAHARVWHDWPLLRRALMLQIPFIRIEATDVRARAALAAATTPETQRAARSELLRAAEADAAFLARRPAPYARAMATLLRAGLAKARGDTETAARELAAAATELNAVGMRLHAATAEWHLGTLRGGDEGRALRRAAEVWMTRQGIAKPARMAALGAPSFERE